MGKKTGNPSIVDTQRQGVVDAPTNANEWKRVANNGRQPMGDSARNFRDASADTGLAVQRPRGGSKPDPLGITEGAGGRGRVGLQGAQHRITATLPGPSGEAQVTQANGRILKPTHSRSGAFYSQEAYQ